MLSNAISLRLTRMDEAWLYHDSCHGDFAVTTRWYVYCVDNTLADHLQA